MRNSMRSYIIPMLMAQVCAEADMRSKNIYSPPPSISYGGVGSLPRVPNKELHKFVIKGHEIEAFQRKMQSKDSSIKGYYNEFNRKNKESF